MTLKEVIIFEKNIIQINNLYKELSVISKKKHNDLINEFKLKHVNKLIEIANTLLSIDDRPFTDFVVFDDDDTPTISDVVMIISQYIECLERLKLYNVTKESLDWFWIIDDKQSKIETSQPKKNF